MDDILEKIQQICRICLLEQPLMFSLHHKSYLDKHVFEMLLSCATIDVDVNDKLPQLVCGICLERLEAAIILKEQCERSDQTLRKLMLENDEKIDIKLDVTNCTLLRNEKGSESDSEVNASAVVKVEINVNEDEEFKIKNESDSEISENDESGTESEDNANTVESKKKSKQKSGKKKKYIKKPKRERYECQTCKKVFESHKMLWEHRDEHPYYSCCVCFKQFPDTELLEKHNEEHSDKIFKCNEEDCDKEFNNYSLFLSHKKNDHNVLSYLKCFECDESFNCREQWDLHIRTHKLKLNKCEKCGEKFSKIKEWRAHIAAIHPDYFECDICKKHFKSNVSLERHKIYHDGTLICEECGKSFAQKYHLKRHIDRVHKGLPTDYKRNQLCTYCGQCYRRPFELANHILSHTGAKPFACDKCDFRTHTKQLLHSHVLTHSGERLYTCKYCNKSFKTRNYLTIHTRIHTGYRPYKCSHAPCEKTFTNGTDLRVHERTHTGVKLYHCNICNNSFTTLHYFKVHTKKHEIKNEIQ